MSALDELAGTPMFSLYGGHEAKVKGIKQVSEHEANLQSMVDCIFDVAHHFTTFTADEVMEEMDKRKITPHHPNAIGAAFAIAAKQGLIESSNNYQASRRTTNRSRMVRIWRSAWRNA